MKKLLALLLAATLLMPSAIFANDATQQETSAQLTSISKTLEEQNPLYYYIPLKNAAQTNDSTVAWDAEDGTISLSHKNKSYLFETKDQKVTIDSKAQELTAPILLIDGKSFAHYDDISFLYEESSERYPITKKNTVAFAYYALAESLIPGITFSFVDVDNDYLWEQGFGYADIENKEVVTNETLFEVGSISKSFTAMAIMQLVEQEKIDLDEKIVTYLPDFKLKEHPIYGGNSDEITVRMLLSHYSGIAGDYFKDFATANQVDTEYMSQFLENLSNDYMQAKPTDRNSYANNGYTVLGILISRLTSDTADYATGFSDYMNKSVLEKMDMHSSSFISDNAKKLQRSSSYTSAALPKEENLNINALPAGSMLSCAKDMSHMLQTMLQNGTYNKTAVLAPSSVAEMQKPVDFYDALTSSMNFGLGMYSMDYNGKSFVGHGGDVIYFHSYYQLLPDYQMGAFSSGNSANSISMIGNLAILSLDSAAEESGQVKPILNENANFPPNFPNASKSIEEFMGSYLALGTSTLGDDGSIIFLDYVFTSNGDNTFTNETLGNMRFSTVDNVDVMLIGENFSTILTQKIIHSKALNSFKDWVGVYLPQQDSKTEMSMFDKVELLIDSEGKASILLNSMSMEEAQSLPIERINDDLYYVLGYGRNLGIVISRQVEDGKESLEFMGITFEKQIDY